MHTNWQVWHVCVCFVCTDVFVRVLINTHNPVSMCVVCVCVNINVKKIGCLCVCY